MHWQISHHVPLVLLDLSVQISIRILSEFFFNSLNFVKYVLFQHLRKECDEGYYSFGNQEKCDYCPEGYRCPHKHKAPELCGLGFYSEAKSVNCTGCEAGFACPEPQATRKIECKPGTYSSGGAIVCKACDPGYRCKMGSTSPRPEDGVCDKGGWCDGQAFFACPSGTYNPINGSSNERACVPCPPGYFCTGPGEIDYSDKLCPAGHYCLQGTTISTNFPCPGGTYYDKMNATSENDCLPCPEGYYCPPGNSVPLICPAGFWCTASQSTGFQNSCPLGTFSSLTGLKSNIFVFDAVVYLGI